MLSALAPLALAAVVAAAPQGAAVTANIAPSSTAGPSCSPNYAGAFQIQLLNATSVNKRSLGVQQRAAGDLFITLSNGVLKDSQGRTGYIAANRQFQFDGPAQAGAIYTAGWTVCSNGSLAIGADAVFDACLSGEFYNLYDENAAPQCSRVYIQVVKAVSGGVTQIGDGQVQASGAVTQIGDGQIQAPTGVVTQIGDGQIQAPTGVVTQIGDGQIQAPTGVVTQIGDGQIQAPTGVVTQIGDGQIQAPTGVVTQIGDGQIQAPTGVVTQIADGQIQAPTGNITTAKPTTVPYTGAASTLNGAAAGLVGALMVAVAML